MSWNHGQIPKSILYQLNYRIIKNHVSKIFSLFAKFYMTISTTMAHKPYIETTSIKNTENCVIVTHQIKILILRKLTNANHPWVPWVHSTCTLTAFCFELMPLCTCRYAIVVMMTQKKSVIYDTKDAYKEVIRPSSPTPAKMKMIHQSARGHSHHHYQIGLIQHNQ